MQKTVKPDIVAFKTDFNVTFGIFVCFDMMFAQPAMSLINHGIKHFVYPTMWSSEIPYLTGERLFYPKGVDYRVFNSFKLSEILERTW